MPLTPLRIRGKKRTAADMSSAASSSSTPASPGGRDTEIAASKKKKKFREAKTTRRGSILERLPVELLVMVFTESQNMDLKYCNRHIHEALNNNYSHVRLVARAFAPTWSVYFGRRRREEVDDASEPPVPDEGCLDIVRCQENLIRKKFFTIDLVLAAQQRWYDEHQPGDEGVHFAKCECDHCNKPVSEHLFNAVECFEHDFQLAKASVGKRREGWMQFRDRQDVELGVKMQPKHLHGPWDEKDERLIFWLVAGGAFVDRESWDPQECINIVHSHTDVHRDVNISTLFVYGARHLVSFTHWPLQDAYNFYLSNKPWPPGSKWDPICRKLTEYQRGTFEGDGQRAIRSMRREWGRDVNDSDLPYDSENDSGDDDYW